MTKSYTKQLSNFNYQACECRTNLDIWLCVTKHVHSLNMLSGVDMPHWLLHKMSQWIKIYMKQYIQKDLPILSPLWTHSTTVNLNFRPRFTRGAHDAGEYSSHSLFQERPVLTRARSLSAGCILQIFDIQSLKGVHQCSQSWSTGQLPWPHGLWTSQPKPPTFSEESGDIFAFSRRGPLSGLWSGVVSCDAEVTTERSQEKTTFAPHAVRSLPSKQCFKCR